MKMRNLSQAKGLSVFTLLVLCALVVAPLTSTRVMAQAPGDTLEEDDFDFTPPQAPGAGGNNGGGGGGGQNFGGGNNGGNFNGGAPGGPGGGGGGGNDNSRAADTARKTRDKFAGANPEDITNENFPDLIESFDYPNADIVDVVKAISELTGKNFILDNNVTGKITIMAPTRITVAEAYRAFLSALAIRSLTVVPSGKFLKIVRANDAGRDSVDVYSGAFAPSTDEIITRIIQLRHVSGRDIQGVLNKLANFNGIDYVESTNTFIVTDKGSVVEKLARIIQQVDVAGFDEQLAVIAIRHAKVKDMADMIDQIINKGQKKNANQPFAFGAPPRFGANDGSAKQAYSTVIPDERTNTIIVVGNNEGIMKIRKLVKQLDFDIPADEAGGVFVYYVQYGDAEKLATVFTGITQAKTDTSGKPSNSPYPSPLPLPTFGAANGDSGAAGGMLGANVKVTASKETNSLIIVASRADYQTVKSILKRLDIPRDQVYVEMIIAEMNLSSNDKSGFNYYMFAPGSNGYARSGFVESGTAGKILDITQDSGAILGFGSGSDVQITGPNGTSYTVKSVMGFINFLKQTVKVNVLSTPQVVALDNDDAMIEVGDRIPTSTSQNTTAAGTTSGVNFEDATLKLKINPAISKSSDSVRIKIEETMKSPIKTSAVSKALQDSTTTLNTRNLTSNVVLHDGDTAILGGLIRDQEDETVQKVPLLGDLPLIGWFFRNTTVNKTKIDLLVFITPKIIRSALDHTINTLQHLSDRVDFIKKDMGGHDPHGAHFDKVIRRLEAKVQANDTRPLNGEPAPRIPLTNKPADPAQDPANGEPTELQ